MKKLLSDFFELRGTLSKKTGLLVEVIGFFVLMFTWCVVSYFNVFNHKILPAPWEVVGSFKSLHFDDFIVRNALYSIKLNVLGYFEAVAIGIPVGFLLGLFPIFRTLFSRYVNSVRFVPTTALIGLFIALFGIDDNMKIQFLAAGILVYLIPVVIQRIDEVEKIYVDTLYTLGAFKWKTIRYVFIPKVMSRISDDVRNLVAISWTYIIVAELVNTTGGIGAMAYRAGRYGHPEKLFAILMLIVLIGFIQDKSFVYLDKKLFPHKHK